MNILKHSLLAVGIFLALPVVTAFAAEAGASARVGRFNNQLQSGGYQGNTTPTKPPVLTQATPYTCNEKTCSCNNASDCGRMGQAGVCKPGTFGEVSSLPGHGYCAKKPV